MVGSRERGLSSGYRALFVSTTCGSGWVVAEKAARPATAHSTQDVYPRSSAAKGLTQILPKQVSKRRLPA